MTKAVLTFCCQTALTTLLIYEALTTEELVEAIKTFAPTEIVFSRFICALFLHMFVAGELV